MSCPLLLSPRLLRSAGLHEARHARKINYRTTCISIRCKFACRWKQGSLEGALAMIRLTYDFKRLGMRADRTTYPHKAFMPIAARTSQGNGEPKKGQRTGEPNGFSCPLPFVHACDMDLRLFWRCRTHSCFRFGFSGPPVRPRRIMHSKSEVKYNIRP